MLNEPDWSAIFAPSGRLLREGDTIRRENLSRTLYTIAEQGPDAFYKGPIADAFVAKVQETGGIMTQEDMESYQVKVSRALEGTYRGKKVYTPHAPTSGPVLLHMLNLVEHYDDWVEEGRTVLSAHRFIEAMKCAYCHYILAYFCSRVLHGVQSASPLGMLRHLTCRCAANYAYRTWVGDPAFHDNVQHISAIPTKDYANKVFPNITDVR